MNPGGPLQPPQTTSITAPTSNQQISIIQPSQIQNNGQYFYQIVNPQVQPQFSVIGLQGLQGLQGLYPYGLVQNGLKPTPVQGFQVLQGPQNVSNLQLAIPQLQAVHVQASPQLFIQAGELQQQAALPPGAARLGENTGMSSKYINYAQLCIIMVLKSKSRNGGRGWRLLPSLQNISKVN